MTFKDAAAFKMPFGKHKGCCLDAIASDDDGLKYLDWLRGERGSTRSDIDQALAAYLDDPSIKKDLENLAG